MGGDYEGAMQLLRRGYSPSLPLDLKAPMRERFIEAGLQAGLSWDLLQFVHPGVSADEAGFKKRWRSVRLDAIENYVRGLTAASFEQKHRFFTQASSACMSA